MAIHLEEKSLDSLGMEDSKRRACTLRFGTAIKINHGSSR